MTTDRTRPRQPLSPDIIEDMLARRRNGESLREIACVHGVTSGAATLYIRKDRQPPSAAEVHATRQAHGERATRIESIVAPAPRETLQAIGHLYGLTRERVRQIVDRENGPTAARIRADRPFRKVHRREHLAALIHAKI
jgi:hypothetical protein